nr:immunoglobulin light chain junction region [Macaca mulatta]
CKQALQTPYSF